MKNSKRLALFVGVAVMICVSVLGFGPGVSSQSVTREPTKQKTLPRDPVLENFDVRVRRPAEDNSGATQNPGQLTLETTKRPGNQRENEVAAAIVNSIRSAQQTLAERLSGLHVEFNETARVPEIVGADGGAALATASKNEKTTNESTLRGFLSENAALYGLTEKQVTQLTKTSDYSNPAGNLSFVEFQQEFNGIPVFQGYVRGILAADGRLMRTTGLLAAGIQPGSLISNPQLSATEAVAAGAASLNIDMSAATLNVLKEIDTRTQIVSQGVFDEDVKTELVYFPLQPGNLVLAYSMVLWQPNVAYYILVDAKSGSLLWRKNITQEQTQSVTYNIYNSDGPTPSSPTICTAPAPCSLPPGTTRTDVVNVSENAADNLGWIPDGATVTTGNNVDAGLDIAAPNGIDPTGRATGPGRVFSFPYIPDGAADPTGSNSPVDTNYRMGIVTNLFFWTNRYHDRLYDLGFTEPAGNFQNNNFGRGGVAGADFVRAEAQDSSGTNNANFSTPPDGSLPRMQMFIFLTAPVNRDGDVDQDVNQHELTHGTSNRLHANATGLGSLAAGGMGEGWSDFYAMSLLSTTGPAEADGNGIYSYGGYVTKNFYYGIRRFPYAVRSTLGANGKPHNPLTFADIDPTQINITDGAFPPAFNGSANEVHNAGEVWCSMLMEVRARLMTSLGVAAGNQRALQIVTDGMKLDPVNPDTLSGRNSILAADCAGFGGADELDIWNGFKARGAGFRAGFELGGSGVRIHENFDGPNLTLGTVIAVETTGNGNGSLDPGETVSLAIPLTNTLCATSAINTSATLAPGGGSASYGTITAGGNGTQNISFTIPTNIACGSAIPFTITVNSDNLGPIDYTYFLPIGQPTPLASYQNFDGVTAPALPSGWTTTHTGASLGWATSTTNADTAPNAASTSDPANVGTGSLISPPIPVDTAQARLSFRNLFNLETGFDTLTLQIKIDSGSFQDILAAGGSFVSGGYNSPIGWTGLSAGTTGAPAYITSVVNLPTAANGHIIQLRWTVFGDANTIAPGVPGARIDSIQLSTTTQACSSFGVSVVSLSGRIADALNTGLNGIQVSLTGGTAATATTSGDGNYTFTSLLSGGNYAVTPTTPGYEYTPANLVFNNLTTDVTNADFTAIPAAGIAGRVTTLNGAQGIDGITLTLAGTQTATTTTAGGGFYSFSPLTRFGNYTVTPSGGNNNIFAPPNRTYNNLNSAVTDANFTAAENLDCTAVIGSPITGSIAAGDTAQTNRLTRDGNPSSCAGKLFPGETVVATIRYDTYTFTNTSGSSACVRVTIAADFSVHSVGYLNSYDPLNKGTNYLGDLGIGYPGNNSQASYSINVPSGATYVIVVNETAVNVGGNYTLSLCSGSVPPPAPAAPPAQPGQVLITEFRQSVGATNSSNEYVELYNNTEAPISIGGYGLVLFNAAFGGDVVLGFPANVVIPRRRHLLIVNTAAGGYSLGSYATADLSHANANLMPDNQGFGLIDASRSVLIDSVGFVGNSGNVAYIEGVGLRPTIGARPNVEHAWVRKISKITTYPQDTDNNAADFQLVSVTGATFTASPNIQSILGAPGPENLSSPPDRSLVNITQLVDPLAPPAGGENRVRFATCGLPNGPPCPLDINTSANGYLSIRRKVTNNTGAPVTRLRFRIVDITTLGSPAAPGQADIRALTSGPITVTIGGSPVTIQGTTLEQPPTQALAGGLNSSMSVGTITLGTPLPNGGVVNVQWMLGVQQTGSFRFWVTVEGLP